MVYNLIFDILDLFEIWILRFVISTKGRGVFIQTLFRQAILPRLVKNLTFGFISLDNA